MTVVRRSQQANEKIVTQNHIKLFRCNLHRTDSTPMLFKPIQMKCVFFCRTEEKSTEANK